MTVGVAAMPEKKTAKLMSPAHEIFLRNGILLMTGVYKRMLAIAM